VPRLCGQGRQSVAVSSRHPGISNFRRQTCARVSRDADGRRSTSAHRECGVRQQHRPQGPCGDSAGSVAPRAQRAGDRAQNSRSASGYQSLSFVPVACSRDATAISRAPGWMESLERGGTPRVCDCLYQGGRLHRWLCGPCRARSSVQSLVRDDAHPISSRTPSRSGGSPGSVDCVQPAAILVPPANGPASGTLTFNRRHWSNGNAPTRTAGSFEFALRSSPVDAIANHAVRLVIGQHPDGVDDDAARCIESAPGILERTA
jgi:hypothetical protein